MNDTLRFSDLMDTVAQWDRQRNTMAENLMAATKPLGLLYGCQPLSVPFRPASTLAGMPVYYSEHAGKHKRVQVRFPKSRKKRMVMRWFKDPKNWESWFEPGVYILNGKGVMMHSSLAATVVEAIGS